MLNAAVSSTMADRLEELGHISADRLRLFAPPGTATVEDLLNANSHRKPLCELIDQTLVEKAGGFESSLVAATILAILHGFVASTVRAPDVAFVSREQLPDGKFPAEAYPPFAPDLVVEVLSPGNTKAEMSRKRVEYFHSGTRLVWMVDCVNRSVAVYTSPSAVRILNEEATMDGGEVLPGFSSPVADFFADLDLGSE
jgi:hypothetical protein